MTNSSAVVNDIAVMRANYLIVNVIDKGMYYVKTTIRNLRKARGDISHASYAGRPAGLPAQGAFVCT